MNANYTVNQPGAKTLKDAQPMTVAGKSVTVVVDSVATLFLGTEAVAERPAADITSAKDAQDWAVETLATATEIVAETVSPRVEWVRAQGTEMLAEVDAQDEVTGPFRFRTARGTMRTLAENDPRHPANAAKTMRARAAVLMAWTAEDETGYQQYVSDGLADTDGYFAPEPRYAWKR